MSQLPQSGPWSPALVILEVIPNTGVVILPLYNPDDPFETWLALAESQLIGGNN